MMTTLKEEFQRLRSANEPLPDEAQCPGCGYFDVTQPDVRRILIDRDPSKLKLASAQCRCIDQEAKLRSQDELRRSEAGLPTARFNTFDNFKTMPGTEDMVKAAGRFLRREGPRLLTLVGNTGCGKSHILEAIGRAALDLQRTVRYDQAGYFLDRLRHTYSSDRYQSFGDEAPEGSDVYELMNWYAKRSILIIDDIGYENATPWVQEKLKTLFDNRMANGGWTATATNLNEEMMSEHLGPRIASRIFATSREEGSAEVVVNTAGDYRK